MSQVPAFVELIGAVKEGVKTQQDAGAVRNKVIETLVNQEVSRRSDLLLKSLEVRKAAQKELDKIKPDIKYHDGDGKMVAEHYSPAVSKSLKTAKEKLAKIDKAIGQAVNEANYDELAKVASGKVEEDKPAEAPAE